MQHKRKKVMMKITFINKYADSSNIACSTHQERRRINERSREHRGSQRLSQIEAKTQASPIQSSYPQIETPPNPARAATASNKTDSTQSLTGHSAPLKQQASHAIIRAVPGNTVDPFGTSSVPITSVVIRLLRYYKEVYYASLWDEVYAALHGKVRKETIARCSPERVILECMENQSRMNTLLADIGCHWLNEDGIDPAINSLQLLQRGTTSLREEFRSKGSNVDCNILLDALHLCLAVTALGQQDAAQAHLDGLKAIIKRILAQGAAISISHASMLALVDPEISCLLLSRRTSAAEQDLAT